MHEQPEANVISIADTPLWAPGAAEFVAAFIGSADRPISVLEYGSGGSTLFLLAQGAQVTTVEHHAGWAEALKEKADSLDLNKNLTLIRRDRPYSDVPSEFAEGLEFDILLVDGRERVQCIMNSLPFLRPDGLMLLDDSQRARYWPVFRKLMPYAGLTFRSKERDTSIWLTAQKAGDDDSVVFRVNSTNFKGSFPPNHKRIVPVQVKAGKNQPGFCLVKKCEVQDKVLAQLQGIGLISPKANYIAPTCFELENAQIRILKARKYFKLGDKTYLSSSSGYEPVDPIEDLPSLAVIPGRTLDLTAPGAARYAFFLTDALPKLGLLGALGEEIGNFENILINSKAKFLAAIVEHVCGVKTPQILAFNKQQEVFQFERSLHIESVRSGRCTPKWIYAYLDSVFASRALPCDSPASFGKRVFISRQKSFGRRVLNESGLDGVLSDYGFTSVYAENHSPLALASLLRDVEIVLSPHGAGLANTIFCRRSATVIELFSSHFTEQYYNLARDRGQQYIAVPCHDAEGLNVFDRYTAQSQSKALYNREDISVPLDELRAILDELTS